MHLDTPFENDCGIDVPHMHVSELVSAAYVFVVALAHNEAQFCTVMFADTAACLYCTNAAWSEEKHPPEVTVIAAVVALAPLVLLLLVEAETLFWKTYGASGVLTRTGTVKFMITVSVDNGV